MKASALLQRSRNVLSRFLSSLSLANSSTRLENGAVRELLEISSELWWLPAINSGLYKPCLKYPDNMCSSTLLRNSLIFWTARRVANSRATLAIIMSPFFPTAQNQWSNITCTHCFIYILRQNLQKGRHQMAR